MIAKSSIDLIGYTGATLTTISFVPQLLRVIKLRSARDVSLGMFIIFTTGTFLWLIYGWLCGSLPVTFANAVTCSLSLAILILKLKYDRRATNPVQLNDAPR